MCQRSVRFGAGAGAHREAGPLHVQRKRFPGTRTPKGDGGRQVEKRGHSEREAERRSHNPPAIFWRGGEPSRPASRPESWGTRQISGGMVVWQPATTNRGHSRRCARPQSWEHTLCEPLTLEPGAQRLPPLPPPWCRGRGSRWTDSVTSNSASISGWPAEAASSDSRGESGRLFPLCCELVVILPRVLRVCGQGPFTPEGLRTPPRLEANRSANERGHRYSGHAELVGILSWRRSKSR